MAIIPNDEQFVGVNSSVDMTERKSSRLNSTTQIYTLQDFSDSLTPDLTPITVDGNSVSIAKDPTATTQDTAVIQSSDTNAGIAIVPNGTGAITASIPDGTATGGNARGQYAVDLQRFRQLNSRVSSGSYSTIFGGSDNTASGDYSISGGRESRATVENSISIGKNNNANGTNSLIIGGNQNVASATNSSVIGGGNNNTSGIYSIVSGASNTISSSYGTISGGQSNTASTGTHATVVGGGGNTSSGQYSVSGGQSNTASGNHSVAFGLSNTATANYAVCFGNNSDVVGGSSAILSGRENRIESQTSVVAGGRDNYILGGLYASEYSGVLSGRGNTINNSLYSTISGGQNNTASTNTHATVVGGSGNTSSGQYSISGGYSNVASGQYGVALGSSNSVSGGEASVALGRGNTVSGWRALAVGDAHNVSGVSSSALGRNNAIGGSYAFSVGQSNSSGSDYAISMGNFANSNMYGSIVNANGKFQYSGDAQVSRLLARKQDTLTTGGTTVLSLDGTGTTNLINFSFNSDKTIAMRVRITWSAGINNALTSGLTKGDCIGQTDEIMIKKLKAGFLSIVGTPTVIATNSDASMSSCTMNYTVSGHNTLTLTFQGPTFGGGGNLTARVLANIETTECTVAPF